MICPCGSEKPFQKCCELFHQGKVAQTPEQLMRSRYSAFVVKNVRYLSETWHRSTRPTINLADNPNWQKLEIVSTSHSAINPLMSAEQEGEEGFVHFKAFYEVPKEMGGGTNKLEEKSRFIFEKGRWWYTNGHIL